MRTQEVTSHHFFTSSPMPMTGNAGQGAFFLYLFMSKSDAHPYRACQQCGCSLGDPYGVTSENEVLVILKTIIIFALQFKKMIQYHQIFVTFYQDFVTFYQDCTVAVTDPVYE